MTMTVTSEGLRSALRAAAHDEPAQMQSLRRAIEQAGGLRLGTDSLDDILVRVLMTAARGHGREMERVTDSLREALMRILDDLELARGNRPGVAPRAEALRHADLERIAQTIEMLETFDDYVRRQAQNADSDLAHALDDLLPPDPISARNRALSRGADALERAEAIARAYAEGRTVEAAGLGLPLTNPRDPALTRTMQRLRAAIDRYRANPGTDAAAAEAAASELARMTNYAGEHLRANASGFEVSSLDDVLPPSRPPRADAPGAVHEAHEAAQAARETLRARPDLVTSAPAAELFDALQSGSPEFRAEGTMREGLARGEVPGVGLEGYMISAGEVGRLRTEPPGLAARLASFLFGWQRAHLVGPGFGSELFAGLALAPEGVNQIAQRQGIELLIRHLRDTGADPHATITAKVRRLAVPLASGSPEAVDVLSSIRYEVTTSGRPAKVTFEITVHPDGSWSVTHDIPPGLPGADVALAGAR
ncbi:polymorphic toxin type 4 domain-containing protein [Microbacterium sp. 10M-3C3]|jgi:hypothetical protein|uniref:polymorphic toxin type 4 domain-containing protein n=1 Tax=Microbacterium sp. 10M-3C3 TaxID=2483401 RepID=UPI000F62DC8D|nr:polymorphic toxin type 4 domain-containing protein [Microbacterium sp. 10M-3C3]